MDSRQQFENSPRFKGMDFTRSVTHPDYYESPYANGAWDGWQASRESIVVNLPRESILNGTMDGKEVRAKINEAGIRTK